YVGQPPMTMAGELRGPRQLVEWNAVDIRDLDAEPLVTSQEVSDNVIGILARLRNEREAVRRIVARFTELPAGQRNEALEQLIVLSGLRRMDALVKEEANRMPVYIDLGANVILGPAYHKGLDEGRAEGEVAVLRRQIRKRFGALPEWAETRLTKLSVPQLEELS